MADCSPRRRYVSQSHFNGANFCWEEKGQWKSIWDEHKIIAWSIGPISAPSDYLSTVFDNVILACAGAAETMLPRSPRDKLQLVQVVVVLSLRVKSLSRICYL